MQQQNGYQKIMLSEKAQTKNKKKKYILYDFISIKLKILDFTDQKQSSGCLEMEGIWRDEAWQTNTGSFWGVMDMLTSLIKVMVSWIYTYIKKYQIVYVQFIMGQNTSWRLLKQTMIVMDCDRLKKVDILESKCTKTNVNKLRICKELVISKIWQCFLTQYLIIKIKQVTLSEEARWITILTK